MLQLEWLKIFYEVNSEEEKTIQGIYKKQAKSIQPPCNLKNV